MEKQSRLAFCVHGHFYQPRREDPLSDEIPTEAGAAPFKNWNERINAQCYRPNAELNNFEGISFDLGPTLSNWMAQFDPKTLQMIVEQDQANVRRYGVGNAMAQGYHHTILPLASTRDKLTQIVWGIEDFRSRFGHHPSGFWLPETAVDLESLDLLAQHGIQFTILAPWQAKDKSLDKSKPYWVQCREGRKIVVFFYNQDLSTRVSFDPGATANADQFVHQILYPQFRQQNFSGEDDQFLIIASDGEAYGHHHPFRDKFLSYLLTKAIEGYPIKRSFPALWLQTHPPQEFIEIEEDTSWSCHHGVKRWSEGCDCTPHSEWKSPLRDAMNAIASGVDEQYEKGLAAYQVDPWNLRNEYIQVVTGKLTEERFIQTNIPAADDMEVMEHVRLLLAAQNDRQRVFVSCGWFFDDFDRIEPRNNVKYAAQAVWLIRQATGVDLSPIARKYLRKVKSWRSSLTGEEVFNRHLDTVHEAMKATASKAG